MIFLGAFLVSGLFCVVMQFFYRITRLSVPNTLAIAVAIGGILTATGGVLPLLKIGDGGMILLIVDSGQAAFDWMTAILERGDFGPCAQHLLTLLGCWSLSALIGGRIYHKRYGQKDAGCRELCAAKETAEAPCADTSEADA